MTPDENSIIRAEGNLPDLGGIESVLAQLTPAQIQQLTSFNDPAILLEKLITLDWTQADEIESLVHIARHSITDSNKLSAIRQLRELINSAMDSLGLRAKVTKTVRGEDGTSVTFTADMVAKAAASARKIPQHLGATKNDTEPEKQPNTPVAGHKSGDESSPVPPDNSGGGSGGETGGTTGRGAETNSPVPAVHADGHKPPTGSAIRLFPGIAASTGGDPSDGGGETGQ